MDKKQVEVLNALDLAKTQWYHFTAVVIAGMGFFTDVYDFLCIATVSKLLGRIYYFDPASKSPGSLPPNVFAAVNVVALCGGFAGQLFFGWMGDKMGRKKVYGMTLMLMVVASIASGLSFGRTAKSVMTTLCFFRFWLGFGIGGDYPLSATIMSEYANKKTRGAFMAAVYAMQGFGVLAGAAAAIIVSAGFNRTYMDGPDSSTGPEADFVWRIILMLGAIPAALTYFWRMRMPETARYTALIERDEKRAVADMCRVLDIDIREDPRINVELFRRKETRFGLFSKEFIRRHGLHLLGAASTWFLDAITLYSTYLFQNDIFTVMGWLTPGEKMNAIEEVYRIARAQSIIALCSTVPGYWVTVLLVDRIGRKPIQLIGFFLMTIFMFALAIPYDHWRGHKCNDGSGNFCGSNPKVFLVLYAFTFFFQTFGPSATTFIVAAEIFPTRMRSTCHGICGAAGMTGGIIAGFGFMYAAESTHAGDVDPGYHKGIGMKNTLICLGVTNALGLVFTLLIPETNGKSLEELSRENEEEEGIKLSPIFQRHCHNLDA